MVAPSDEQAIGIVVDEMYAMVSGPAGPRDWSRNTNCFLPEALQVRTWVDDRGRSRRQVMTLDEFTAEAAPFLETTDFYEIETGRRIDLFGNIAHVWSAYEARCSLVEAVPERRGVNSIQLIRDPEHGWRIIHMIWDNERRTSEN